MQGYIVLIADAFCYAACDRIRLNSQRAQLIQLFSIAIFYHIIFFYQISGGQMVVTGLM